MRDENVCPAQSVVDMVLLQTWTLQSEIIPFSTKGATITVLTLSLVGFVVGQQIILPMADGSFDSFTWMKLRDLW